jgi:hypothetical protein
MHISYDWTLLYDSEDDEDFVPAATSERDHDLFDSDSDSDDTTAEANDTHGNTTPNRDDSLSKKSHGR